ncbi:MAG: hypothetical protein M3P27_08240 [Acidobacteriota bacterium]|nr:hypothetical protein [Acidobacteriota bacterium]
MSELLISEVTRMGDGFCVIGLMSNPAGVCSLRPMPHGGFAWRPFPYRRADRIAFDLQLVSLAAPHLEDRVCSNHRKLGSISEDEMLDLLQKAELGESRADLFGCAVRSTASGATYVKPGHGERSICGCRIENISFDFSHYPKKNVRAALLLASGDRLDSLPVVDDDWLRFIDHLWERSQGTVNIGSRLQRFFNQQIKEHVLSSAIPFVRIGLTRPFHGRCWLMLDSLFPVPKRNWVEEFLQ